jgi:purine-nucleoside phosphorylase
MKSVIDAALPQFSGFQPRVGVVLGSGLGSFAETHLSGGPVVDYAAIAGFPQSTVEGHRGRFVCGRVGDVPVICAQGRFHFYEGYSMAEVASIVRLMAALGIQILILTNAAGGIRAGMQPGDLMVIRDHINMLATNPLIGPNDPKVGPRFPDMTAAWDAHLATAWHTAAAVCGLPLHDGVYLAVSGPAFETPAEVRAFRTLGADAVGMSTVPECIVARHCGLRVTGVSCITNLASGLGQAALSHDDVAHTAAVAGAGFRRLLDQFIRSLA